MTRDEAIEHACGTVALAYRAIGDYSRASDGFCHHCPAQNYTEWNYRNDGHMLEYVRLATIEKLEREGYDIPPEFSSYDPRGE